MTTIPTDYSKLTAAFPKGHSMMSKSFPRAVAEAVCAALEADKK